jgi:hypothetical protein
MANEIGWGRAFDPENGYGMAAVNGAEIGYGTVVINSHSGQTNISSMDADNTTPDGDKGTILDELPLLYMDGDNMYLYFNLNPTVTPVSMTYNFYQGDRFYSDGVLADDGIHWIAEFPADDDYYLELTIVIDSENTSVFTSNILTV